MIRTAQACWEVNRSSGRALSPAPQCEVLAEAVDGPPRPRVLRAHLTEGRGPACAGGKALPPGGCPLKRRAGCHCGEATLTRDPGLGPPPCPAPRIPASGPPLSSPDLGVRTEAGHPDCLIQTPLSHLPAGSLALVANHAVPWTNKRPCLSRAL
uniref:Uncharacterized protein n=1 Tax=Molossus molossus TaxID=27622 RepID=A0A7J8HHP2_MOLMO|nr:hypothetical protein HJG59_010942 [Molossus molossus]